MMRSRGPFCGRLRGRKLRIGRKFDSKPRRSKTPHRSEIRLGGGNALVIALPCSRRRCSTPTRPSSRQPRPVPTPESTADLAAMKKAAGIADCPRSDPGVAAVPSGLPDVVLPCLGGGREVRLAGLRGKPMMINVWAQWCEPCREEAPYLAEVRGKQVRFDDHGSRPRRPAARSGYRVRATVHLDLPTTRGSRCRAARSAADHRSAADLFRPPRRHDRLSSRWTVQLG